jgi:hypothetical protein|tara:strand:- start:392103 stop:392453 length:351 start_codon:yes stop_codon:yes gene_type:complete
MKDLDTLVDGFIKLNMEGKIMQLCEQYYADDIIMTSDGKDFATSREEASAKQKIYVDTIAAFVITLLSKDIEGDKAEITFHYDITTIENKNYVFTGKHVQQWADGKMIREDYEMVV